MLSEYIDGVLPEAEASEVRSHLDECAACMEMYRSMKEIIVYMNDMEQVDPPAGFVGRVNERLKNDSPFGRVIRGIFHPLRIKVPIEIAGLAAAVVLIVYISGFVGKQGVEDALPVGTGREVAERFDGPGTSLKQKEGIAGRIPDKLDETDSEKGAVIPLAEEGAVAPSVLESATTSALNESEKKKADAGITGQKSSVESESGESRSAPEFAGTTQEILVEAPVKRVEIRDSDVSYKVTSDELEELPVDDVVEALALKGGIVKTGDDLHVRGGSVATDLPDIDSSPDSILAELSRSLDMFGGRIIDYRIIGEKKIAFADTDVDATRIRASRYAPSAESISSHVDSLGRIVMKPIEVIVPRSELERLYMAILRIGSVRPVEMKQIAEEGDSVRLRIEFP